MFAWRASTWWLIALSLMLLGCDDAEKSIPRGVDLQGSAVEPAGDGVTVLLFLAPDCPISNRYAPTIRSIADEHQAKGVRFWLVYPDPDVSSETVRRHSEEYGLEGIPALRDPSRELVEFVGATTVPEAAVLVADGSTMPRLVYRGRIDDRFVDFGVTRSEPTSHDLRVVLRSVFADDRREFASAPAVGCPIP